MAKIMLVEDDNNLREIYQARLSSEGYETVTASDGEEALSIVGREKPDLIILDVMMPKISGFDTLDLLKNNPLTKDIKVIMMTALSQAEDRARAEKLGAQNYLVKSQVTLEDIVKTVKDTLAGDSSFPSEGGAESTAPHSSVFNNNQGDHSMTPTTPDADQSSTVTPDPMSTMTHGNAGDDNMATVSPTTSDASTMPATPTTSPSDMGSAPMNDASMPSTPSMDPPTGITDFGASQDAQSTGSNTSLNVDHQDGTTAMPMASSDASADAPTMAPPMDSMPTASSDTSSTNDSTAPSMTDSANSPTVTPVQTFFTPQPMQDTAGADSSTPTTDATTTPAADDQADKTDTPVDSATGAL